MTARVGNDTHAEGRIGGNVSVPCGRADRHAHFGRRSVPAGLVSSSVMVGLTAQPAAASDSVSLPSGAAAWLQEVLSQPDEAGIAYRFRFVSEGFSPSPDQLDRILADLRHLCESHAIPHLREIDPQARRVIISLADQPVEFGVVSPYARQVFEVFTLDGASCIWEAF